MGDFAGAASKFLGLLRTPTCLPRPAFVARAMQAELEHELRQAEGDFSRGDFIELTIEELDRAMAAGVWPWPDGSGVGVPGPAV